ncbi:MAG: pyridoxamine 5'-phosphate oxidase family protein [Vulcanimicrobiota bacterium]
MRHLTKDEISEFLGQKKHWIILTSLDSDGFPHSVPMGYFVLGSDIYMGCKPATRKVRNIDRNPKVSLLLESGRGTGELIGVLVQGYATVVRERKELLALKQAVASQRGEQPPTSIPDGFVYIRVRPERVISWDRTKR